MSVKAETERRADPLCKKGLSAFSASMSKNAEISLRKFYGIFLPWNNFFINVSSNAAKP